MRVDFDYAVIAIIQPVTAPKFIAGLFVATLPGIFGLTLSNTAMPVTRSRGRPQLVATCWYGRPLSQGLNATALLEVADAVFVSPAGTASAEGWARTINRRSPR